MVNPLTENEMLSPTFKCLASVSYTHLSYKRPETAAFAKQTGHPNAH